MAHGSRPGKMLMGSPLARASLQEHKDDTAPLTVEITPTPSRPLAGWRAGPAVARQRLLSICPGWDGIARACALESLRTGQDAASSRDLWVAQTGDSAAESL